MAESPFLLSLAAGLYLKQDPNGKWDDLSVEDQDKWISKAHDYCGHETFLQSWGDTL